MHRPSHTVTPVAMYLRDNRNHSVHTYSDQSPPTTNLSISARGSGERCADGCTSGRNASSQGEPTAYQARWHRFGVGLDSVRPPELRAVRGSLAFSRWRHASASPSRIGGSGERWADHGCTSGRNASEGERTAYQARWHRFGLGLESVRPPELRAVRGLLAVSRWRHARKRIPVKDRLLG